MPVSLSRAAPVSLFIATAFIMLAYGLQSSVLGVRAVMEEFSSFTTGLLMTGFYAGLFGGSLVTPRLIAAVGHIRVFAGLASIASSALLLHPIFVEPVAWAPMRLVTGFSYAGLYIVIESWLNEVSDNSTRGRMLALYSLVMQASIAGGYLLLNLGNPAGFAPFTLVSILISLSLVPLTLGNRTSVMPEVPEPVSVVGLSRLVPLGVVCVLLIGAAHAIFYSMGAVYGRSEGWSLAEISVFLAAFLIGGMILQWPIGALSDRIDRRWVMIGSAAAAASLSGTGAWLAGSELPEYSLGLVTMGLGGFSLPVYGVVVAYINDHLRRSQIVPATSRIMLLVGAGAAIGPTIAGAAMDLRGPAGFYVVLGGLHGLIAICAALTFAKVQPQRTRPYQPLPPRGVGTASGSQL